VGILIETALAHAKNVNHGQEDKDGSNGDDAERHADAVATHALLARPKIPWVTVIAVVAATAVPAPVGDFPWTSAAQLRPAFDLYAIANDRRKTTPMALCLR